MATLTHEEIESTDDCELDFVELDEVECGEEEDGTGHREGEGNGRGQSRS